MLVQLLSMNGIRLMEIPHLCPTLKIPMPRQLSWRWPSEIQSKQSFPVREFRRVSGSTYVEVIDMDIV